MGKNAPEDTYKMDWGGFGLIEFLLTEGSQITTRYKNALDIGSGSGNHTEVMRRFGLVVDQVDKYSDKAEIQEDFMHYEFSEKYDVVFCSHVIEHQRNVGAFLDKIFDVLDDEGKLILTTPKHQAEKFIEGHLSACMLPLLIQNLIHAGFDCKSGKIISGGPIENCFIVGKAGNFDLAERQETGYRWTQAHQDRSPIELKTGVVIKNIADITENCDVWYNTGETSGRPSDLTIKFPNGYVPKGITIDMSRWGMLCEI